jgi:hypothetical protein
MKFDLRSKHDRICPCSLTALPPDCIYMIDLTSALRLTAGTHRTIALTSGLYLTGGIL